jgi:hypothetical protein
MQKAHNLEDTTPLEYCTNGRAVEVEGVGYAIQLSSAAVIGQQLVHPAVHPVVYRQQYFSRRI